MEGGKLNISGFLFQTGELLDADNRGTYESMLHSNGRVRDAFAAALFSTKVLHRQNDPIRADHSPMTVTCTVRLRARV